MKIPVSGVRKAAEVLFDHLEQNGYQEVDVGEVDSYWWIPREKVHEVYGEPSDFTIGILSDNLGSLREIATGSNDPIAYAFVWLSAVLRAIGENVQI